MLRTVTRALRRILLALGVAVLLLWPASYVRGIDVFLPVPGGDAGVAANRGSFILLLVVRGDVINRRPFNVETFVPRPDLPAPLLMPKWESFVVRQAPVTHVTTVYIPLWLLALLCLAWPVTSFIVARKRRGARGFEVTPASGSAAPKGQP